MKFILALVIFLKKLGFFYRLVGIVLAVGFFVESVKDLKFNHEIKKIKSYTLKEVMNIDRTRLPLYFGVSDVSAYGDSYVLNSKVKYGDTTLSSIIYPVYQNDILVDKLKEIESYVVVIDDQVKKEDLQGYFLKNVYVNGKFDDESIDDESMKILTDSGYKIAKNCIVLKKGSTPMSIEFCIASIFGCLIVFILLALSFVPNEKLERMFASKTIII